jgi:hypothetical protein
LLPSARASESLTKGRLHFAQLAFTDIPHLAHEYVAAIFLSLFSIESEKGTLPQDVIQ